MGILDRKYDNRLAYGSRLNPLVILIVISMIIFVVLAFFKALAYVRLGQNADIATYFNQNILSWFALKANASNLLTKPWTLITCTFVHTNIWQLFASMVWLWCFGFVLVDLTGFSKLIPVFIYGTLAAAAGYLISANIIFGAPHSDAYFIGGTAAVLAVSAAATTISPHYKLLPMLGGGISLWVVSIIFLVIDLATLPPSNPVLYIAHLCGALAGFLFIILLRRGVDGSSWMNNLYDWFINLFTPVEPSKKQAAIKSTLFYKADKEPFLKTPHLTQKKLDDILDKINQSGFDTLSQQEKDFLKRASEEDLRDK